MTAPDMDVIKDIPGYKVILKAVLKSQIQQLVEQLASHTDEESVILTASVSDGTLSHLGSDSGKNFLDDHEDIKSQFLGFCLKRHHRKKQEKEKEEAMRQMPKTPPRYGGPRPGFMPSRSPRFSSPRHQGIHPVALTRASPGAHIRGMRHEPYPIQRPPKRSTLNFEQNRNPGGPSMGAMRLPLMGNKLDGQVIKIEADEQEDTDTNQSVNDNAQHGAGAQTNVASSSQPSSPSQTPTSAAKVKSESSDKEDDAKSESSSSTIPNETSDLKFSDTAPPEGLSLDSDLSNLISGDASSATDSLNPPAPSSSSTHESHETPGTSGEMDPNINVKVEAITESEMELEITGVELGSGSVGDPMGSQDSWTPGRMGPGATGSQADMTGSEPGYKSDVLNTRIIGSSGVAAFGVEQGNLWDTGIGTFSDVYEGKPRIGKILQCQLCGLNVKFTSHLEQHMRTHTGEKPFVCKVCGKSFRRKYHLKTHMVVHKSLIDNLN